MGLFDKIFGRGAAETVKKPDDQTLFNQLKEKYKTALQVADTRGIRITTFQLQGGKLYLRGVAPSEEAKSKFWDQIKFIDSDYSDLSADITVVQTAPAAAATATNKSYTVKSGDTLSKISKEFYGDSDEYMRIFYANRDKLSDPDEIQVGQVLVVPPDDDN